MVNPEHTIKFNVNWLLHHFCLAMTINWSTIFVKRLVHTLWYRYGMLVWY